MLDIESAFLFPPIYPDTVKKNRKGFAPPGPRKSVHKNYKRTFHVRYFLQQPTKFTGKNTLFGFHNASFFLLKFDSFQKLSILTNNSELLKFQFRSERRNPSRNYVFSNFITGVSDFLTFTRSSPLKLVRDTLTL